MTAEDETTDPPLLPDDLPWRACKGEGPEPWYVEGKTGGIHYDNIETELEAYAIAKLANYGHPVDWERLGPVVKASIASGIFERPRQLELMLSEAAEEAGCTVPELIAVLRDLAISQKHAKKE